MDGGVWAAATRKSRMQPVNWLFHEADIDGYEGTESAGNGIDRQKVEELRAQEYHFSLLKSLEENLNEQDISCLCDMLNTSEAVHHDLLDLEIQSESGNLTFLEWLDELISASSDSDCANLMSIICAVMAFSLSNSEVGQVMRVINASLSRHSYSVVSVTAQCVSRLGKRKTGIPDQVVGLGQEIIDKLMGHLDMADAPLQQIFTAIGSLVPFIVTHDIPVDLMKFWSFFDRDDIDSLVSSSWCLTNFVLYDNRFLDGVDLSHCVFRLVTFFSSSSTDHKLSLAYPIVILSQFLDPASLTHLFREGLLSTFSEILSFKSVLVIEVLLRVVLQGIERDPSILQHESIPDFLTSLALLESSSDFPQLIATNIPSFISEICHHLEAT